MTLSPIEGVDEAPIGPDTELLSIRQHYAEVRRIECNNILQMPIGERFPLVDRDVSRWTGSYEKMPAVLAFKDKLSRPDWLRLLGEHWTMCDNIRNHRLELRKILGTQRPLREMMDSEENAHYDSLPETVTCYRGCDASVLVGASWTLNKEIARRFPTFGRYRARNPVLITATVKKANVLAVIAGRKEEELITFSARRVTVETGQWSLDRRILWPMQEAA
jgi:hypothetical protein